MLITSPVSVSLHAAAILPLQPRFPLHSCLQLEELLEPGKRDIPVAANGRDLGRASLALGAVLADAHVAMWEGVGFEKLQSLSPWCGNGNAETTIVFELGRERDRDAWPKRE